MSLSISYPEGGIAVVRIDHPPVNALSQSVRSALIAAVDACDADPSVHGVVLLCAGRTFIAGADVAEFDQPPTAPHLPDVTARIEAATKPWLAAIHGSALGGGLEVALACRWRVALASAQAGLPEVRLGLLPGAGGTVRLPRLVGAATAVDMVTTGSPVSAQQALKTGLFDALFEDDLPGHAVSYLRTALQTSQQSPLPLLPVPLLQRPVPAMPPGFWDEAETRVRRKAGREAAPLRALESLRTACSSEPQTALAFERTAFLELRASPQARALRHVFFAERAAARPLELDGVTPRPIRSAAVVGGGTMGAGIAVALRDSGLPVLLIERDETSLQRGLERIRNIYDASVKRGRLTEQAAAERLQGIRGGLSEAAAAEADLVVEAVFEDLQVKREVFARLAAACRADAILTTNTSYLDPSLIAHGLPGPERCIGLHFFSPAQIMKLLEIVPLPATAPDVLAAGFALARKLGKVPVRAGICDGFIGNRILRVLRAQAERLLLTGATPRQVDQAMRAYGMPMGPFEAQDLGGLDIAAFQRRAAQARGEPVFAPVADHLCELGRLGQKTSGGWYDYAPGSREPQDSPAVAAAITQAAAGTPPRAWNQEDIADCIVFPMVDEAARILQEGIALRPEDIDLVEIHGYGFPRWRGGLLHDARERGFDRVVERLHAWAQEGLTPLPCERLQQMAQAATVGR